jgi:hypothetical protein
LSGDVGQFLCCAIEGDGDDAMCVQIRNVKASLVPAGAFREIEAVDQGGEAGHR